MQEQKQHGGARPGSGRPAGSSNRRSQALSEGLIDVPRSPWSALRTRRKRRAGSRWQSLPGRRSFLACTPDPGASGSSPRRFWRWPGALRRRVLRPPSSRTASSGPGTSAGCRVSGTAWRPRARETGPRPRLHEALDHPTTRTHPSVGAPTMPATSRVGSEESLRSRRSNSRMIASALDRST